jgi:ligand-binding sensor protein
LTDISNSCEFCNLILAADEGRRRCAASWQRSDTGRPSAPALRTCHAGLLCVAVPIVVGEQWVANVAGCQFVAGDGEGWMANLSVLASEVGLDEGHLREAADSVRVLGDEQVRRVVRLLQKVADTFAEIGQERQSLIGRLERIAEITKV